MFCNVKSIFKYVIAYACTFVVILLTCTVFQKVKADTLQITYSHSDLFNQSDKLTNASAKKNGTYYTYEHGKDGYYTPMTQYVTNPWFEAWSADGAHPMICSWFIGGSAESDGALIWHGNAAGHISISSTLPVCTDASGKTAKFMILSRRNNKYCPVYPTKGEFEWKTVTDAKTELSGIEADVEAGDEILFLVRMNNDIINIDPKIDFTQDENVTCKDEDFDFWPDTTVSFTHSDIFNSNGSASPTAVDVNGFGFSYCGINEKGVFTLNNFVSNEWYSAWTDNENAPMISSWFIGGSAEADGALIWHGNADGIATINSTLLINNDSAEKKAELMIAVKRGNKYFPIYPTFAEFEWKEVTTVNEALPQIEVNLAKGDEIVFAVRSDGNVVTINPKIDFKFKTEKPVEDSKFAEWKCGEKPPVKYSHSGCFNDSDKELPRATCADGLYFTYEFGKDGVFEPMTRYSSNAFFDAWTSYGEDPMVSSFFISSIEDYEGAIVFHSDKKGSVTLNSSLPIKSEAGKQPALFMIVQRRKGKIYPLYPTEGKFEWKTVSNQPIDISGVNTVMSAGDTLEIIVKSDNAVMYIDPQVTFLETNGLPELSDGIFFEWEKNEEEYVGDKYVPYLPKTGYYDYIPVFTIAIVLSAITFLYFKRKLQ